MIPSYENILASEPPFRPNIKLAKYVEVIVMLGFYLGLIQNSENSILKKPIKVTILN